MDDTVIITIKCGKNYEEDFEVPVGSRIEKWKNSVEDYLKQIDKSGYTGGGRLSISYNENLLNENNSLQELNLWDGIVLEARWI